MTTASRISALLLTACVFLSLSCTTEFTYTQTIEDALPTKSKQTPEHCDYKVYSVLPQGQWQELGIFSIKLRKDPLSQDYTGPKTPEELKALIAKSTCKTGGEIIVGHINHHGIYIRATVYKKIQGEKI